MDKKKLIHVRNFIIFHVNRFNAGLLVWQNVSKALQKDN